MSIWRSLLMGIVSSTGILFAPSYVGIALAQLAPQEISAIAKPITVRIDGADEGSGVIIDEWENTYTVLTNRHVVEASGQYIIQTHDGQQHTVEYSQIEKLSDEVDLALITFYSENEYEIAEFGESETLGEGQTIHLAGYPGDGQIIGESDRIYRFDSLSINAILPDGREGGYSLSYGGENFSGMSGGPIIDSNGDVIGINGINYQDADGKARSNYAIPIDTYFELAAVLNDDSDVDEETWDKLDGESWSEDVPANIYPYSTALLDPDNRSPVDDFVKSKLDPIPVFAVVDEKGAPISEIGDDGQKRAKIFISQNDANESLARLKTENSELADRVRVVPVSLGEVYQLAKTESLVIFGVPQAKAVSDSMITRLTNPNRQPSEQESYKGGVPLFVAKGGEEKGYMTIERDGQQVIPFFFDKQQLEAMIAKFKEQKPELADTVWIEVHSLNVAIETLETSDDKILEKILLVPTEESLRFLQEFSK